MTFYYSEQCSFVMAQNIQSFHDIITELDCIYWCAVFKNSDYVITDNVRLETGSLEQQLLLSYDATEIRGLVEKLVAANPAKSQWRINNKVN